MKITHTNKEKLTQKLFVYNDQTYNKFTIT